MIDYVDYLITYLIPYFSVNRFNCYYIPKFYIKIRQSAPSNVEDIHIDSDLTIKTQTVTTFTFSGIALESFVILSHFKSY